MSEAKRRNTIPKKRQLKEQLLNGMIMPNIVVFFIWGLFTALFIPTGWVPNEYLSEISMPMIKWLIPLLIGYSGGNIIYQHRGGVLGAIATTGIIAGSDIPMLLGAMIVGPFAGWCIKFFDEIFQNKISTEFKIHINNFSGVILGSVLAIFAYIIIGPVINFFNNILCSSIEFIIKLGFIPLISILIEPAKILFLSDTINNSIFNWVGIQEYQEFGKSIFFMIIANPGPGLGVLLAFCLAGKDMAKSFAPGAVIIHFLGGIHEIYFPYIFMKPILLLAVIPASMAGIFILSVLNGGLVAPISTSSIFTILAMMPQDAYFANIIAIVVATTVSFIITFRIIRPTKEIICSLENTASGAKNYSNNNVLVEGRELKKIVYVCDAGLGSSAIGVNLLYNKLKKAGYGDISVTNCVIGNIPSDAQIVVSYESLADYVIADSPQAEHLFVQDFTKNDVYNIILAKLKNKEEKLDLDIEKVENMDNDKIVLRRENIKMNLDVVTKEEAIKMAGELLYKSGYVDKTYINGMLAREQDISTYMGRGIAIPHGENAVKDTVKKSGVVVLQFPNGVEFGTGKAKLVVGIAGKGEEHLTILAKIAVALSEYTDEQLEELFTTKDKEALYNLFAKTND